MLYHSVLNAVFAIRHKFILREIRDNENVLKRWNRSKTIHEFHLRSFLSPSIWHTWRAAVRSGAESASLLLLSTSFELISSTEAGLDRWILVAYYHISNAHWTANIQKFSSLFKFYPWLLQNNISGTTVLSKGWFDVDRIQPHPLSSGSFAICSSHFHMDHFVFVKIVTVIVVVE